MLTRSLVTGSCWFRSLGAGFALALLAPLFVASPAVAASYSITLKPSKTVSTVDAGFDLVGYVKPAVRNKSVYIEEYVDGQWIYVRRTTTNGFGKYRTMLNPDVGTHRYRARTLAFKGLSGAATGTRSVSVNTWVGLDQISSAIDGPWPSTKVTIDGVQHPYSITLDPRTDARFSSVPTSNDYAVRCTKILLYAALEDSAPPSATATVEFNPRHGSLVDVELEAGGTERIVLATDPSWVGIRAHPQPDAESSILLGSPRVYCNARGFEVGPYH